MHAARLEGLPQEVVLHVGRILEWLNINEQERTPVESAFWECFEAERRLSAGERLSQGDPRGLKDFRVARDVHFRGRTRLNQLTDQLRLMLSASPPPSGGRSTGK